MTTFSTPPGGSSRDRFNRDAPELGIGVLPSAPGLAILPPVDRGAVLAAQLETVLGLTGQAFAAAGEFSASERRRRERVQAATEQIATDELFGLLRAGRDREAIAAIDRRVAAGEISESNAFAIQTRAEAEIARDRALLESRQSEIETEQRGLGAAEADVFLASETARIARGEPDTLIADGADIARSVEDRLDIRLADLPEPAAEAFKRRALPALIRAHTEFTNAQRRSAISESINLRASALAAADTREERQAIIEQAKSIAAHAPDLLTERDAVAGVSLAAAELAAQSGNLKLIDELAAMAGGMPGEPLGLQFEKVRGQARERRHELQRGQESAAREGVYNLFRRGEPITAIETRVNELAENGQVSEQFASGVIDQIHGEIERQAKEAEKAAKEAAQLRFQATVVGGMGGILADPTGPGLSAALADPSLLEAAGAAGFSDTDVRSWGERAVNDQMAAIQADETLTPRQRLSRQVQMLSVNGVTSKPWSAVLEQGASAAGAAMLVEGQEIPPAALSGYHLWAAVRTENPFVAASHVTPETRRFYESVDLAKRYLYPDDQAAGTDNTGQAVRHVLRGMRAGAPATIASNSAVLKGATDWIDGDAFNGPEVSDQVRRLAELYLGSGVVPGAKEALKAASENVRASVQKVGDHYVYARDLRLPDQVAKVAEGIIEGFAARYGPAVGLDRRQIALMPDPGGTGLWQMYDVSGGVARPIQTSLPGGGSLKPGAVSFTPEELSAMAAGILPPPDYAAETVSRFIRAKKRESFWGALLAPLGESNIAPGAMQ